MGFFQALKRYETKRAYQYRKLADVFDELRIRTRDKVQVMLSDKEVLASPAFQTISLIRLLDGTGLRETAHTRILAWIFNPAESHGFGEAPLRGLLQHYSQLGKFPFADDYILSNINVSAERPLSCKPGKRIDIWISGRAKMNESDTWRDWLIVIEAKVRAPDSPQQLSTYKQEATNWVSGRSEPIAPILVFLTSEGKSAKYDSDGWIQTTYEPLVAVIWNAIKGSSDKAGFHLISHYITGVLFDVCNWPQLPCSQADQLLKINPYSLYKFFGKMASYNFYGITNAG